MGGACSWVGENGAPVERSRRLRAPLWYDPLCPVSGLFLRMPNIKQQEKRVRRAARERLENLRYRSTVKTMTRRLEAAVEAGDQEAITSEHRELLRWIDKAASHGALHRNAAARKKAQAARLAGRSA
jgi:small subunit ribosomal protein S20